MPKKQIRIYDDLGKPREDMFRLGEELTGAQILEYHEACKAWHIKVFGESEAMKRTKGKRIVIWTRPAE